MAHPGGAASVDLYWLPLGAGGRSVRLNGRAFEAIAARRAHRPRRDLYHSALEVRIGRDRFVIEMAPAWGGPAGDRGVVGEGAVGSAHLSARSSLFRYEIRRWRNGTIPDLGEAIGGAHRLPVGAGPAEMLLERVPRFPTFTWGRDEQLTGDMWNSNSLTSWLLAGAGVDLRSTRPPTGGRAPGWAAGLVVANRGRANVPLVPG